ncbi:unnamed protein product [Linum trigynum]|uniref:FBD domain-containing protein n=1 Tax=Linum trigynum TaxID=586398 RepID=A0AAV2D914_9ROSI
MLGLMQGVSNPCVNRVSRQSIKVVEVIGFDGLPFDSEFLEYALDYFVGLERIVLSRYVKTDTEAKERALAFKSRASPAIDFVII